MTRPDKNPFGERETTLIRRRVNVLGGICIVESANQTLMRLALHAFAGLPNHRLTKDPMRLRIHLTLSSSRSEPSQSAAPRAPLLSSGAGFLCAVVDSGNFAIIDPQSSRALISVTPDMLKFSYFIRRELIEMSFLTLSSRAQKLVPLHAACLGKQTKGLLLMGPSGAGKSTLTLHGFAKGMVVLSEDSTFVEPRTMKITGTPNFLYVRADGANTLEDDKLRRQIERSPIITRRSGVQKYALDLRKATGRIARTPLTLVGTVFLSRRRASRANALTRLDNDDFLERLNREQAYAIQQSNWPVFKRKVVSKPCYELRQVVRPQESIDLLESILDER